MKAVIYHADSHYAWGDRVEKGMYERFFTKFKGQAKKYGLTSVVHLTLDGCPAWGDENISFPNLDRKNVMLNREECFTAFLESAPDDVYWFCEPDYHIYKMWPPLKSGCDAAMCFRVNDGVPMSPGWRMATPKGLPFFRKLRDTYRGLVPFDNVGFDWHGDSWAFTKVWEDMGSPKAGGIVDYLGVKVEFRDFSDYLKGRSTYGRNYFGKSKFGTL